MSNALAISATTAALRNLLLTGVPVLDGDLADLEVTTQPPDVARKNVSKAQLNLFLYQTVINGAWRNLDMPRQVRPGETGFPPLALNLHYLITAYGRGENDNDALSHRVFGSAMSVLHDHPLLDPTELTVALPASDVAQQFERIRITPLAMSIDDISKLWTAFQSQYRLSTAYEVTVVLIDSQQPTRSAAPVLRRGEADRGVTAVAGGAPALAEIRFPRSQPAARLGDDITLLGSQLATADTAARFTSLRLADPIELTPTAGSQPGEIGLHLPSTAEDADVLNRWAPGFYTLGLVVRRPAIPPLTSNELAFALAPQITVAPIHASTGTTLTVTCAPRIVWGAGVRQRVLLLFGDQQVEPKTVSTPADPSQPTTLEIVVPDVEPGTYLVRLRVDGVDSIPVILTGSPPLPTFDPAQQVIVA